MRGGKQQGIVVRTYRGSQAAATKDFRADAASMAASGYFPTSQSWAPGSYGCGAFLVALLLCFLLIGILVFIYMLFVKPSGTLTVTYEWRAAALPAASGDEKTCPQCAETVKAAAKVCRFCRYEFTA
jgi:hypothetical protein